MSLNKITAVIPVRAGSKRLVNKNLLAFGSSNLLEHKITQLKELKSLNIIDDIVVSSDSDLMLDIAKTHKVKTHKRADEFADEVSKSFSEVIVNVVSNIQNTSHILWAPCVCPLCGVENFKNALEIYNQQVIKTQNYDSVISVVNFQQYLWDSKKPINYVLGKGHVPSQKLPHYQTVVNGFYIAPKEKMLQWEYFCGTNPYRLEISQVEGIDIDTEFDYICAKACYRAGGGGIVLIIINTACFFSSQNLLEVA